MKSNKLVNYSFLAVVILWPPINRFVLTDFSGKTPLIFAILALFFTLIDKSFFKTIRKESFFIWLIWIAFSTINWKSKNIKLAISDLEFILKYILLPYVTLIISYIEFENDFKKTGLFLSIVYLVYIVLGLFGQGSLTFEGERGGMILGNDLPLVACSALFLAAFCYRQGYCSILYFLLFLFLSVISTLFVAERKTFVVNFILALFTIIPYTSLKKPSNWIPAVIVLLIFYYGADWFLNNTLIGERFADTTEQAEKYTDNFFLSLLGDRAGHYVEGWPLFLLNPITGIGLRNFSIVTANIHPLHTEYMVQLVEGGIIGSLLFLLFAVSIVKQIIKAQKSTLNNPKTLSVCWGELISLFLLCFITWTYDSPHYFISIAVILAYCNNIIQLHKYA